MSANRDHWLGVELRHFAALEAIASERSFRGAADRLGYVQSAVSTQIATLERIVGTRLVERSRGHGTVDLTAQGDLLLHHARRILGQLRAARADLDRLDAGEVGTVRIGVFPSAATRVLPQLLIEFARLRPGVAVVPVECATDCPIFELVEDGELDLGFSYLPIMSGPFAACELVRAPTVLLVAAGSPLARASHRPTLAEIARLPLISGQSCRLLGRLEDELRAVRGTLDVVFRSDLPQTTQTLVGAGIGVALTPRFAVDERDDSVAIVELGGQIAPVALGLFWHRDRVLSAATEAFGEFVRERCAGERPVMAARSGG